MKKIYHGDNYNTSSLEPALMNNGNNEIGIGISFGSYDVAATYGKNIVSAEIDTSKFVNAKEEIGSCFSKAKILSILKELHPLDKEKFYYELSDWGYEIEIEEIEEYELSILAKCYKEMEVRNFQTSLAGMFGVEKFVEVWNKHLKIDGTFLIRTEEETWYAIINPSIPVVKEEESRKES